MDDDELTPEDQLAQQAAMREQAKAEFPNVAAWHRAIYEGYLEVGFDEDQAERLLIVWMEQS